MKSKTKTIPIVIEGDKARILFNLTSELDDLLARKLGYYTDCFIPQFQNGRRILKPNGRPLFRRERRLRTKYRYIDREFPAGMVIRATKALRRRGYKVKVLDKRSKPVVDEKVVVDRFQAIPFDLRPYQISAITKGVHKPMMTFHMATGTGKTVVFGSLIKVIGLKTLVIVNRTDLLQQHVASLTRILGEDQVGIIQGSSFPYDKQVNVAMVQTIYSRFKRGSKLRNVMLKYLNSIQYLVGDESHHAKSDTYKKIYAQCKNAMYRHSFSGSPWDQASENIELETVSGPILFRYTTSNAIEDGYLARPYITFHRYKNNDAELRLNSMAEVYEGAISANVDRNKAVCKLVAKEWNTTERKMLVVVQRINHGYLLASMLRKLGIPDDDIGYLHGQKGRIVREAGRKKFEEGKIRIMIVSNIWNEGIDIASIDVIVKADAYGGGDDIKEGEGIRAFVQQIGRVLRKPIDKKIGDVNIKKEHSVYVHDFIDLQHKFVENWTRNRIATCKMEKAFVVKVEGKI